MDQFGYEVKLRAIEAPHSHISSTQIQSSDELLFKKLKSVFMKQFKQQMFQNELCRHHVLIRNLTWSRPKYTDPKTGRSFPLLPSQARLTGEHYVNQISCYLVSYEFATDKPHLKKSTTGVVSMHENDDKMMDKGEKKEKAKDHSLLEKEELAMNEDPTRMELYLSELKQKHGPNIPVSKHTEAYMDEKHFNLLQTYYEAATKECNFTEDDRKKYPYLLKAQFNTRYPFFQIPAVLHSVGCWISLGTILDQCMYSDGSTMMHNDVERFQSCQDKEKDDKSLILSNDNTNMYKVENRSGHTDVYRSTSTITLEWKEDKSGHSCLLAGLPWLKPILPVHVLFHCLKWKRKNNLTVEQQIVSYVYEDLMRKLNGDEEKVIELIRGLKNSMPDVCFIQEPDSIDTLVEPSTKRRKLEDGETATSDFSVIDEEYKSFETMDLHQKNGRLPKSTRGHEVWIRDSDSALLYLGHIIKTKDTEDIYLQSSTFTAPETSEEIRKERQTARAVHNNAKKSSLKIQEQTEKRRKEDAEKSDKQAAEEGHKKPSLVQNATSVSFLMNMATNKIKNEVLPSVNYLFKNNSPLSDPYDYNKYEDKINFHKGMELIHMISLQLLYRAGYCPADSTANFINRSLETQAVMILKLVRMGALYHDRRVRQRLKKICDKGLRISLQKLYEDQTITSSLQSAVITGIWTPTKSISLEDKITGVTQVRSNTNVNSYLSQTIKTQTPIVGKAKEMNKRRHQNGHGIHCLPDTPDGENCGLQKSNAWTHDVSFGSDSGFFAEILSKHAGIYPLNYQHLETIHQQLNTCEQKLLHHRSMQGKGQTTSSSSKTTFGHVLFDDKLMFLIDPTCAIAIEKELNQMKFDGLVDRKATIVWDKTKLELHVDTEAGRWCQLMVNVDRMVAKLQKPGYLWYLNYSSILNTSIMSFVSKKEEDLHLVALDMNKFKHYREKGFDIEKMLLHPTLMIHGPIGSQCVFDEHNPAARTTYYCGLGKSAMGVPWSNLNHRVDTNYYLLKSPMNSPADTVALKLLKLSPLGKGKMCRLLLATYDGTLDDAYVINMDKIRLGFGRTLRITSTKIKEKSMGSTFNDSERFTNPSKRKCELVRKKNYSTIDDDGLPFPGTWQTKNNILVGKSCSVERMADTYREKSAETMEYDISIEEQCCSIPTPSKVEGITDRVLLIQDVNGDKSVLIRNVTPIQPELGDKANNRAGQKGVFGRFCTDMSVYTTFDGLTPDIIMNPHGMPSRMTKGMTIEGLASTLKLLTGITMDATSFSHIHQMKQKLVEKYGYTQFFNSLDESIGWEDMLPEGDEDRISFISRMLIDAGYHPYGSERMINPHTLEVVGGDNMYGVGLMFSPMMYYELLHHLANDKCHARGFGPVQAFNRQASEGQAAEGGFKFGEMESWAGISHKVAFLLRERTFLSVDATTMHVCPRCHAIGSVNVNSGSILCMHCKTPQKTKQAVLPYIIKQSLQVLQSACIWPKMVLSGPDLEHSEAVANI